MRFLMLSVLVAVLAVSVVGQAPERRFGLAKPVRMTAESEVYGGELSAKPLADLAAVVKDPKAWKGRTVQVRGTVASVCTKKGCWMMLESAGQRMRVGFKEYGFFVPFDVATREVAVEGIIDVRVESEAERRHYAQDAKKSEAEIAAIKGDLTVISFIADAVQIGKLPEAPPMAKATVPADKLTEGGAVCPDVKANCGGAAGGCNMKAGEKKADCGGAAGGCDMKAGEKKAEGAAKPAEAEKKAGCGSCEKKTEAK